MSVKGSFIVIKDGKLFISAQFGENMMPSVNGKLACFLLQHVNDIDDFKDAISYFNYQLYKSKNVIGEIHELSVKEISKELRFADDYFKNFNSDYLYIKNLDNKDYILRNNFDVATVIHPGDIQVWYFGEYVENIASAVRMSPEDRLRFGLEEESDTSGKPFIYENDSIITIFAKAIVKMILQILKDNECFASVVITTVFKLDVEKYLKYQNIKLCWNKNIDEDFKIVAERQVTLKVLSHMMFACVNDIESSMPGF